MDAYENDKNILVTSQGVTSELNLEDELKAIFVCKFDTRLGNIIEWQIPIDINLEKVEFKALASGLHLAKYDFIYFFHNEMFGLAAFQSLAVNNLEERNIRMKAVGILTKSYKTLPRFYYFLLNQTKIHLEELGDYSELKQLWENRYKLSSIQTAFTNQCYLENKRFVSDDMGLVDKFFNKRLYLYKQLINENQIHQKIYTKLALFMGPSLFSIWKYLLLNKRILFYSNPPIIDLCLRIFCSLEMLDCDECDLKKYDLKKYFYVSITDIERLKEEPFYIACSSERIFESKDYLYDLYINNMDVFISSGLNSKQILKANSSDKRKSEFLIEKLINSNENEETTFREFFREKNNKIFKTLELYEQTYVNDESEKMSPKPILLTNDTIKKMDLDPCDDREFLHAFIRFHNFNFRLN